MAGGLALIAILILCFMVAYVSKKRKSIKSSLSNQHQQTPSGIHVINIIILFIFIYLFLFNVDTYILKKLTIISIKTAKREFMHVHIDIFETRQKTKRIIYFSSSMLRFSINHNKHCIPHFYRTDHVIFLSCGCNIVKSRF